MPTPTLSMAGSAPEGTASAARVPSGRGPWSTEWARSASRPAALASVVALCFGASPAAAQAPYGYQPWYPYQPPFGYYIRGLAGAAFGRDTTFSDVDANDPNAVLGPGAELKGKTSTSPLFGGGIGFKFSPLFWADVTATGITSLKFKDGNSTAGAFTPLQGMTAKVDAFTAMVNGYFDVARALRLPVGPTQIYVMGGVGYARNHMDQMNGTVPGFGPVSFRGGTRDNFAWGAGAGIGIPVTPNMTLDLGYEYLDLGEIRSGNSGTLTISGVPTTAAAGPMKANLQAHTVQLSVRLSF